MADILVIPGGQGTRPLMADRALLAWIAGRTAGAELVMTVCTGALLAAAAGLAWATIVHAWPSSRS